MPKPEDDDYGRRTRAHRPGPTERALNRLRADMYVCTLALLAGMGVVIWFGGGRC